MPLTQPEEPTTLREPNWPGMCKEKDRCTFKLYSPPKHFGFWALAASSKAIRKEAQESFLRRTVISIHPENLQPWLDHLAKHAPRQIDHLRRVTLAGPNTHPEFLQAQIRLLRERVPNLEGVGFQGQEGVWRWVRAYAPGEPCIERETWESWNILEWMRIFDSSVTIALEGIMWYKHEHWQTMIVERQFAVRMLRKGKTEGQGWNDDDVEVEFDEPGKLAESKKNAKWRAWWRSPALPGVFFETVIHLPL